MRAGSDTGAKVAVHTIGGLLDPIGKAAGAVVGAAGDAVEWVAGAGSSVVEGMSAAVASATAFAIETTPGLRKLADSEIGRTIIRANAGVLGASLMQTIGGPLGMAIGVAAESGTLRGAYGGDFWRAMSEQIAWKVREAAKVLGAENAVAQIVPPDLLDRARKFISSKAGAGAMFAVGKAAVTVEELSRALGVREDAAAIVLGELSGKVPDLSVYSDASGRRISAGVAAARGATVTASAPPVVAKDLARLVRPGILAPVQVTSRPKAPPPPPVVTTSKARQAVAAGFPAAVVARIEREELAKRAAPSSFERTSAPRAASWAPFALAAAAAAGAAYWYTRRG